MVLPEGYHWLSDEEYGKLLFRTRAHFARILSGLRKQYGQQAEVDGAIEALMYVTEQSWQVVRGKQKPITIPEWYRHYDDEIYTPDN